MKTTDECWALSDCVSRGNDDVASFYIITSSKTAVAMGLEHKSWGLKDRLGCSRPRRKDDVWADDVRVEHSEDDRV